MKVMLIHGANASTVCWNWVGSNIENHDRLTWGMMTHPKENILRMEQHITEPCVLVGHSMGGLYAWHLAERNPDLVTSAISIGTPFGGDIKADMLKLLHMNIPWLGMFSRLEPWTLRTRNEPTPVPWTNVVTTHGFDMFTVGPNDGVITVRSQRELGGEHEEIVLDYGHNEVLQSQELVNIIHSKL